MGGRLVYLAVWTVVGWIGLTLPAAAFGVANPPDLCRAAAERAARATGVPLTVLSAISLTESGRTRDGVFGPWPWTMNIAGAGHFFDSREDALAKAHATLRGGQTSFDMGCFQINYRWHGEAFASLDAMLDPDTNALYAARFLTELYLETGDWSRAAGHYHSRTPEFAGRYRAIFERHLARLGNGPLPSTPLIVPDTPRLRENGYALLQAGGAPAAMGSLVPDRPGRGHLFPTASRSLWGG